MRLKSGAALLRSTIDLYRDVRWSGHAQANAHASLMFNAHHGVANTNGFANIELYV